MLTEWNLKQPKKKTREKRMVKIVLEPARNGVIKRVIDNNHGGADESWTSTDVYEEPENSDRNQHEYIMKFFFELCEDLGISLGNKFDKKTITITTEWGHKYEPTKKELDSKIKELKAQIESLEAWKNS